MIGKNSKGQMAVEMVLILVVMVAGAITISSAFREQEFFATLVSGPWKSTAGLIQNGVWGPPEDTMVMHPNHYNRVNTVVGRQVQ
jgi:hypothetical protein